MDWDINVLLSQDENLGYWWSTGFGFKSLSSFIFKLCCFREYCLTENFCHRKGSWKPPKTTQLCWLAVTKPLDQNLIMRYQRKEDIHIFYLIPCDAKYLYYSGHTDHFYNQGPNGKWKNGEWYVHIVRGPWFILEVQSNFENRIRYGYGYPTKITVPSVFTGCNLIKN